MGSSVIPKMTYELFHGDDLLGCRRQKNDRQKRCWSKKKMVSASFVFFIVLGTVQHFLLFSFL